VSFFDCVKCVGNLVQADIACEACASGADILLCPACIEKVIRAYRSCVQCAGVALERVLQSLGIGKRKMACTTTHTSKVQGAGLCCAAVTAGRLTPPPAGTTLPVYSKGQSASYCAAHPQDCATVSDSAGHCGTCMIVGSKSATHPGKPVLKFIHGGPSCPSSSTGCCALTPGA
jgi:hypothetical protein